MSRSVKVKPPASIAEAIKRERERRGWSQSKLARMLDTPEKNVKNWEGGHTLPSFPLYVRMCLLFEWPLPYSGSRSNPGNADYPVIPRINEPIALALP